MISLVKRRRHTSTARVDVQAIIQRPSSCHVGGPVRASVNECEVESARVCDYGEPAFATLSAVCVYVCVRALSNCGNRNNQVPLQQSTDNQLTLTLVPPMEYGNNRVADESTRLSFSN
jgi:hypothetical protein